jgi:hypothetical protein
MAQYKHYCKECIFVGQDTARDPREGNGKTWVDMYFHPTWKLGSGHFTRRWGNGPCDCWSKLEELASGPPWDVVRLAARTKKLPVR